MYQVHLTKEQNDQLAKSDNQAHRTAAFFSTVGQENYSHYVAETELEQFLSKIDGQVVVDIIR